MAEPLTNPRHTRWFMDEHAIHNHFQRPGTQSGEECVQQHRQNRPQEFGAEGTEQRKKMRRPLAEAFFGWRLFGHYFFGARVDHGNSSKLRFCSIFIREPCCPEIWASIWRIRCAPRPRKTFG